MIPFDQTFDIRNRDLKLGVKLLEELPGIANWLIERVLLWQREGLKPPSIVKCAVAEYRTEEDTLAEFIAEHVINDGSFGVPHPNLFKKYVMWAATQGIQRTMNSRGLARKLRKRGWKETRTGEYEII